MLKITIKGYDYEVEFLENIYCPFCGNKGVYREIGEGDYYSGPMYYCKNCKEEFYLN